MKSLFLRPIFLVLVILFPVWGMSGSVPRRHSHSSHDGAGIPQSSTIIRIPGPLRSFLRMAAISQQIPADGVVPLLAHEVAFQGYTFDQNGRNPSPTEFLILLKDYVEQARELMALAGPRHIIRISGCDQAGPLLKTLGYELAQPCGPNTSLETADKEKAFLTDDSGFPLTSLEQTLRGGKPFEYAFAPSRVPLLFSQHAWRDLDPNKKDDALDALLRDPFMARLYWALARMDRNTRNSLRQSPGLKKLLPLSPILDFYGSQITIRSGSVRVPGGPSADSAWERLVGASPDSPGDFVIRLLGRDKGWLAAYFDALSRADSTQQAYLTQPRILKLFYRALVGRDVSPGPARAVLRSDPGLLLLVSGIRLDPCGQPRIPGNLTVWKQVLRDLYRKDHFRLIRRWSRRAATWTDREQLLESMFAFSRIDLDDGPLQIYLSLSAIDRGRSTGNRLTPETVRLLADHFSRFGDQYLTFSEFPLSNGSMTCFLHVAEDIDKIHDPNLRSDGRGIFEANIGLWKILARQGEIPRTRQNQTWRGVIEPFADIRSPAQLYHAARVSLGKLMQASAGSKDLSQNEIINLLAGPKQSSPAGERVRNDLANKIRSMMAAQGLVSLDTLFALGEGLDQMAHGISPSMPLVPLAEQLRQFQLPKPLFTREERSEWSMGMYENVHLQAEMQTNLVKIIKAKPSVSKLAAAIGQLVPFLRDTLVGLNYAYYEPPGAQMIYNNALFVRSHDFSGGRGIGEDRAWKKPEPFGRGLPAGGGVHLVGSLASLPYVLAEVEQDFIVPARVQALIWEDLVPTLMTAAVLPRWWRVTPNELHAVALYQRFGEELVTAAGTNSGLRQKVMGILSDRLLPRRFERVGTALGRGRSSEAIAQLSPADTFWLAMEFRTKYPSLDPGGGQTGKELDRLARLYPRQVNRERLSEDFGVPHPVLEGTDARALLNVKPIPTYMGYSSRLLAESWQSSNLYWARLADEKGYSPAMLNILVPELTYRMIENIDASYSDDWPALLRSLRETGKQFRQGKLASFPHAERASGF